MSFHHYVEDGLGIHRHLNAVKPPKFLGARHPKMSLPPTDKTVHAITVPGGNPIPKNQGSLGACTDFATLMMMRYLARIIGGPTATDDLSEMAAYYWTRVGYEGGRPEVDSGATIADTFAVAMAYGFPLESEWPYIDDGQRFKVAPPSALQLSGARHLLTQAFEVPDLAGLKASIVSGYPVVMAIDVPESMMSARGGWIDPEQGKKIVGRHALLCDAFDTDRVYGPNSWGIEWGFNGRYSLPQSWFQGHVDDMHTGRQEMLP